MDSDALQTYLSGDGRLAAVRAAAQHGIVEAQTIFGQMLLDGKFLPRDPEAALRWFTSAAGGRHAEAMNMAGRCHELGWGTPAAPDIAASWYRQAAELGYTWGQYNLANLLLRGRGVMQDRGQALRWFRAAAAQGHAKSMNLLGRFYEEGWEIPADRQAALHWYRCSAEAGDFRGQYNYATILLAQGQTAAACQWVRKAVSAGTPEFLNTIGQQLVGAADADLRELGKQALSQGLAYATGSSSPQATNSPARAG